jgi:tRNA (guanine-N7-)-methyltransferase
LDWDAKQLLGNPTEFPQLTSQALFGNQRRLEVEIGMGTGETLVSLAGANPGANYLGIEVSHRAAAFAAALAAETQLDNVRILRANFMLLKPFLAAGSWERVTLHFPDPVHKRSDLKRSLFTPAFLDSMASTLVPRGLLSVASDKPTFFFTMLDLAEGDVRFEKAHPERYLQGLEAPVKSRFQLFWERKGVTPLRFVLRRR